MPVTVDPRRANPSHFLYNYKFGRSVRASDCFAEEVSCTFGKVMVFPLLRSTTLNKNSPLGNGCPRQDDDDGTRPIQ